MVSLMKFLARKSDVIPHMIIVKRRRDSSTVGLPQPVCKPLKRSSD